MKRIKNAKWGKINQSTNINLYRFIYTEITFYLGNKIEKKNKVSFELNVCYISE